MPGSGSKKKRLTAAQQKEQTKERLKLQRQTRDSQINAQNAAKRPEQEEKMNAKSIEAVKKQAAKDAETARLQQLATAMDQIIDQIVAKVEKLRETHPNCNAGDSGIQGGSKNPVAFNSAALSQMKYQSNYDISFTTEAKFRIEKSGQSPILIHVTPNKKQ